MNALNTVSLLAAADTGGGGFLDWIHNVGFFVLTAFVAVIAFKLIGDWWKAGKFPVKSFIGGIAVAAVGMVLITDPMSLIQPLIDLLLSGLHSLGPTIKNF